MPTFGSLFSGIGGLDLGFERAGWTCRWQVEIDPFCRAVLARHWPDVPRYGDITTFPPDAESDLRGPSWDEGRAPLDGSRVDLVCGGFPCQPVSVAGKREGQADSRWLWPEFARVICLLRPRLVLVENVPGLLSANRGDAMGQVLGDLAASGYDAEWDIVSAADVGAPHRRERVWITAYADSVRRDHERILSGADSSISRSAAGFFDPLGSVGNAKVFTERPGLCEAGSGGERWGRSGDTDWWATEPNVGRVAHGVPARVDRLRSLGNAVVPQVAEWIGRRLMAAL